MALTSLEFIFIFLPVLLLAYYIPVPWKKTVWKKLVLAAAGLLLYTLGNPQWYLLLIVSVVVNYILVQLALRNEKVKWIAGLVIVIDVAVLVFFKCINQLIDTKTALSFPLGLSYFTFLEISYVVDSVKRKQKSSFLDTLIYISFFASIVSGPITRYELIQDQFSELDKVNLNQILKGAERFAIGLIKKVFLADFLSHIVELYFSSSAISTGEAWLGAIAYSLQLYFDFSGYSDMAIGTGNMFGFQLAENFRYPYMAKSITEFWRRWHMSLTGWFTQYIYIPLGGNRKGMGRQIFNMWVVWMVTGLWHGTGWTFVAWAMLNFFVILIEKNTPVNKLPSWLRHVYTLIVVLLGWVLFRSASVSEAAIYLRTMFIRSLPSSIGHSMITVIGWYWKPLLLGIVFAFPVYPWLIDRLKDNKAGVCIKNICIPIFFVLAILVLMGTNASAPLYSAF